MFYATYNTSGQSSGLESTTYYYYNDLGNVTRVVTDKENTGPGERQFDSTSLVYARNGRVVRDGLAAVARVPRRTDDHRTTG